MSGFLRNSVYFVLKLSTRSYRVWCWQILTKKAHHLPTRVMKVTQGLTSHIYRVCATRWSCTAWIKNY